MRLKFVEPALPAALARNAQPAVLGLLLILTLGSGGCGGSAILASGRQEPLLTTVAVVAATRAPMARQLTLSSELVPFQEIDVYAKESGYVKELLVDYGTRVRQGQLLAVLDIPELRLVVEQDAAAIQSAADQVSHAQHEVSRIKAQHEVYHLQYTRLQGVMDTRPGLVAQQELDDAQGKDLAAEAQVEAGMAALQAAQSQLQEANAKARRDQVLLDYARVTAPFSGVVTERRANLGTLVQAGTASSTQALPLVRLSQDDQFRLVIPVPESSVQYIRIGDPVMVQVPSLGKSFPGRVARFSVDVNENTRTMHTEVDVPNPSHVLMPGLYAEATLTLERRDHALVLPLQAVDQAGDRGAILLVDPNHCLRQRRIGLGLRSATLVEVTSGLNEGDLVVRSDRSGLRAGLEVVPRIVAVPEYRSDGEP